ncbi:MAG: sulfatase-like hydrolase/transferase [Acidobacteriota bacterium]
MLRYRSTREAAIADVGRAIAMATVGVAVFAPVEYAVTLWAYAGPVDHAVHLAALTATLSLLLWTVLVAVTAGAMLAARAIGAAFDGERGRRVGWFHASPLDRGVRRGVPRLWAVLAAGGTLGLALQRATAWAIIHFKEPQLTAVLVTAIALAAMAAAAPAFRLFALAADVGARALAPALRLANPLGRWRAAGIALAVLTGASLAGVWFALPESRSVLPVRLVVSGVVIGLGMGAGAYVHARPGRRLVRRRLHALVLALASLALTVATLVWWGADLETKYVAITASPALDKLITLVRYANDLDRDGFGSLLGENDCAPFDSKIHPGAIDLPDDGIDQNCDGHDFTLRTPAAPTGPTLPVPAQFKKPWNVLFITIDTLRYDHTTFGGYANGPKHRDTTPRLAELVKHSVSFTFCNAPSAGTMASIPAIITSKYFHSGIALDEHVQPGMPPRLKPENTTLPEIMKRGGYTTGVIASHEYWNDWGMEQGVDDYDNSIGKTPDPYRVAADKSTDHALAWITRQQGKKWFLWVHYIDPHGRYVAHPDVADWGDSEPDKYDEEIKWTDQELGRLFDELKRLPSYQNTIIVITSDHGDSMAEHSVPLGTHGTALYRELQHVPMIFYIPDNQPRLIGGATTNLDIVPTIAELTGIDVHDLSFEGKSEVPALFHGKEDHDRIVFAETNIPQPQRAAISEKYKLIFYMQSNLYELYDLQKDPWEHDNLAPKHPPALDQMKQVLDAWLERVVYARDPEFNQANERIKDVLVPAAKPTVVTPGQTLDDGKLEIAGIALGDNAHLAPGERVDVHVYFDVKERTQTVYKFLLSAWPVTQATWKPSDPAPATVVRSGLRLTAEGFFPTDRWRVGEHVRERFTLQIPADWKADAVAFGLVAVDEAGEKATATGPAPANDANTIVLGALPMTGSMGSGKP